MKWIIRTVSGFSLLLLSSFVAGAHSSIVAGVSWRTSRSVYDSNKKVSLPNVLVKKETGRKRLAVRRRGLKYAGRWTGKLYQPEGPAEQKYDLTLTLYQRGRKITGFSRIAVIGSPEYYGVMRLRGSFRKNRLLFREVKITQENPAPDTSWCIKSGSLKITFVKGRWRLRGNWRGPNCNPGTIVLTKLSRSKP